jgi:hypothetical protein
LIKLELEMNVLKFGLVAALVLSSTAAFAGERPSYGPKGGSFSNSIGGYNNGVYAAAGGGAKAIAECNRCSGAKTVTTAGLGSSSATASTGYAKGYNAATSDTYFALGLGDGAGGVYGNAKWK